MTGFWTPTSRGTSRGSASHLHALVADGLFARSGLFYCLPNVSLKPLEEMFRARVITFLEKMQVRPPNRS